MRQKRNSFERLLKLGQQRLSLDLPPIDLKPMGTPVEEGFQVPLTPYLPLDKKVAAAHAIKGLEVLNQGLVGVAEKVHAEVEEERAARRGEAVSAAVDKYVILNEGRLETFSEDLPGASVVDRMVNEEGQELDESAKRNIAAAIDGEATQRLGFPEKRRKAMELMKAEGMDVTNFPRMLRLFDSLVAEKYIDEARRHIDTNWAALTEPGSTLTVQGMALEAMQTVTGDKTLEWSGVLGMSSPMAQGFKDLVSKKEGNLLPAKSVAKQNEMEKRVLDLGRNKINDIVTWFAEDNPQKAVLATAKIRDMMIAVEDTRKMEGLTGTTRIQNQLWRELKKAFTEACKPKGAFQNDLDRKEAWDALGAGLEAYIGEGTPDANLKLDPENPNEEPGLMPDYVQVSKREADAKDQAIANTAEGNLEPVERGPNPLDTIPGAEYARSLMENRENTVVEDTTKYSDQRIATGKLFTLADGKTTATLAEWFRERPNYLTEPVEGDDLHELVEVVMSDLDKGTDTFSRDYQTMANKAEKETMVRGIVQAQIQDVMSYIIQQDLAAMNAEGTVLTNAALERDAAFKTYTQGQRKKTDARNAETLRRENNASEQYEKIYSALLATRATGISGGGEVGKPMRAVLTNLSGERDEEGNLLLSSSHADYPKLEALVASNEGLDVHISNIAAGVHKYANRTPEVAGSTDPGELPPASAGGMNVGGSFAAYGEEIAPSLQKKARDLAHDLGRNIWDSEEIKARVRGATGWEDKQAVVAAVVAEEEDRFEDAMKKLHAEGKEYRDAAEGKSISALGEITDVMAAYRRSTRLVDKAAPLITATLGENVLASDLITLLSRPGEVGVRKRMHRAGDSAAIPIIQLVNIVGSGNFEALPGWDEKKGHATLTTADGRTFTVSRRRLRNARDQAAKLVGLPMRFWATDGDPTNLTQEFIVSGSTGTNTALFTSPAGIKEFLEEHVSGPRRGPGPWEALRATLLKKGKLGVMENGEAPSAEQLGKIQNLKTLQAARFLAAFSSSNDIAYRNGQFEGLGSIARFHIEPSQQRVEIGSAEATRIREEAYKRSMPTEVRVVPSKEPIPFPIERYYDSGLDF